MGNLQNFGVQELNAKEMSEIEGGSWWSALIWVAVSVLAGLYLGDL